jgi:hypothetical protein
MANQLLTLTMITRESLRILHNNLVFAKGVNRQYSNEFAQTGAKIGSTINVRKPNRYFVRKGTTIQVQNTQETYVPVTLSTQYGVDVDFSSQDLTLSLDDFGKRILSPAMARIASQIDYDGLALAQQVFNYVGTPGNTAGSNVGTGVATVNCPQIYLNAGMLLDNNSTPRDENRRIIINPIAQAGSVANLSGLFQDSVAIGEQYRKGVMGQALGFEFAMDQNVNVLQTGTRGTTASIYGAGQSGSTLTISGTGANATISAGEKFTIANVDSVNPENQQDTGLTQQFTVLAANQANAAGLVTLSISPSIVLAGANVANGTVTALPANGATLTWAGAANGTFPMNLAYHQDAFTLATADLIMPGGVDFAARETYDGISMRVVRAYDITNDMFPCRIDVLAGWAVLRPEMAAVIWG